MLSLDLFDSRYEKRLHEGALDDTITRTQAHLMEPLSRRAADIRTQIRSGKLSGAELDKLEKEYEDLVQKRLDIMLDRQPKNEQQVPSKQDPFAYVKPEPKGIGDIQDPKQKMAQLQQRSKKGPLANVAAGIKAFVKGEPEPMGEQTQPRTHAQDVYFEILKAWEDERDYIVIPFPNANPVTMIRGQIWNAIVDLGSIKDPKRRAKYVEERFNDFESFMSWLGNLKRYKVPAKKKAQKSLDLVPGQAAAQPQPAGQPGTAPGSPLMDPEFTGIKPPGNLQEKKKSSDLDAKDVGLSRELQKARARFPAAASDLEAGILDQMDQQQQAQQALAQQQADLNRQDQQIAGLAQVNQQQDGVMRAQGQEIDRLTQRLQQVMTQPTAAPATAPVTPQAEPTTPAAAPAPDMVYVPDVPADTATQDREIARLNKQIQQLELMMALKTPAERSDLEDRIRDLEKARGEQEEKKRATAKKSAATRQRKKQATTIDMEPTQAQLGFGASGDYLDPSAILVKNRPEPEQGAEVKSAKAKARAAIAKARTKQTSEPQGVSETVENVRAGMAKIYRRLAPKIERHRDSFLAGQLYDELENYAELHGAEGEFKRMMATARNSAHMEYDTNPGGFQNWFWFLPFEDEQLEEAKIVYTVVFVDPSVGPKVVGKFNNAAEAKKLIRDSFNDMYDTGDHLRNVAPGIYVLEEDYRNTGERATAKNYKHFYHWIIQTSQGVAEGISIVDQDSDLDQQIYTLNVDGKKVSFTYWDYENNFQSPDIKDIYQQAREQLGRKLSPEQIKHVARAVFKSFEQGVAEGTDDVKKRMSKLEALALAANRAGDDAKCKRYQEKIQSLKQKLSQSMNEGLRSGEYHIHTVYFKDGTKKRIRVTSDEFDVVGYYKQRGQAVDRVDYDFQIHSDMTEQFAMPGTTIPRKSVIQGYTVFFNPKTRLVSITRGGDSEEAAIEQARIGTPSIKNFRLAADRLITKIESDLNEAKEIVTKNDFLDRRDYLLRMISADSNPANKQIIRAEIRKLESQAEAEGWITMQQRMVREDSDSTEAVEMAIMRRMLVAHTDLIMRHGLDGVVAAIEEVAYDVGEVDEIGTSDVSAYVRRVQRVLEPDNEV